MSRSHHRLHGTLRGPGRNHLVLAGLLLSCLLVGPELVGFAAAERLTNASVIEMHGMGLGDPVLLQAIENADCDFDTSLGGLRRLKAVGLSDEVIAAMLRISGEQAAEDVDLDDPEAPHPAGIYLYTETPQGPSMRKMLPTHFAQSRTGGIFAAQITGGLAKAKKKAVLTGAKAAVQVHDRLPTFYFYFDVDNVGLSLGDYRVAATSPTEFVLARTKVKKGRREVVTMKIGAYGAQAGADDKAVEELVYEELRPGAYRVRPRHELEPGEYCFFSAATTGQGLGGKVYDFGVSDAPAPDHRRARTFDQGPPREAGTAGDRRDARSEPPRAARAPERTPRAEGAASPSVARSRRDSAAAGPPGGPVVLPLTTTSLAVASNRIDLLDLHRPLVVELGCEGSRRKAAPAGCRRAALHAVDGHVLPRGGIEAFDLREGAGGCYAASFDRGALVDQLDLLGLLGDSRVSLAVRCECDGGRRVEGSDSVRLLHGKKAARELRR